jgi:hypothetical protein
VEEAEIVNCCFNLSSFWISDILSKNTKECTSLPGTLRQSMEENKIKHQQPFQ